MQWTTRATSQTPPFRWAAHAHGKRGERQLGLVPEHARLLQGAFYQEAMQAPAPTCCLNKHGPPAVAAAAHSGVCSGRCSLDICSEFRLSCMAPSLCLCLAQPALAHAIPVLHAPLSWHVPAVLQFGTPSRALSLTSMAHLAAESCAKHPVPCMQGLRCITCTPVLACASSTAVWNPQQCSQPDQHGPPCHRILCQAPVSCMQGLLVHNMRYLSSVVSNCFTAFGELLALNKRFAELSGGVTRCMQ